MHNLKTLNLTPAADPQGIGTAKRQGPPAWKSEDNRDALLREFSEILDKIVTQLHSAAPSNGELFTVEQTASAAKEREAGTSSKEAKPEVSQTGEKGEQEEEVEETAEEPKEESCEIASEDSPVTDKQASQEDKSLNSTVVESSSAHASQVTRVAKQRSENGEEEVVPQFEVLEVAKQPGEHANSQDSASKKGKALNQDVQNVVKTTAPAAPEDSAATEAQAAAASGGDKRAAELNRTQSAAKNSLPDAEMPKNAEKADLAARYTELFANLLAAKLSPAATATGRNVKNAEPQGLQGIQAPGAAAPLKGDNAEKTAKPRVQPQPLTRHQAANAMEKVQEALKEVSKSRDGRTISVRLDPPDLGTVKIDVTLRNGTLHARIVTEAQHVNALLRDSSHELQQMLRKLASDVEHVSVSIVQANGDAANSESLTFTQQRGFEQGKHQGWAPPGSKAQGTAAVTPQGAKRSAVYDHWVA